MQQLTNDQIGSFGENLMERWCIELNTSYNKSRDKDDKGWDYILHFPDKVKINGKEKFVLNPVQCLVQVKATLDLSKSLKISLSNFKHLIDSPLPVFFLRIEFNNRGELQRATVTELDKYLIEKVTKKIKSETEKELHKTEITLFKKNSKELKECNSQQLKEVIFSKVGGLDNYVKQKKEWKKECDFNTYEIEFAIDSEKLGNDDFIQNLQDFEIGIKDKLDLSDFTKRKTWFGRDVHDLFESDNIDHMKILDQGNGTKVKVKLYTADSRLEVFLDLEFREVKLFRNMIPSHKRKYRFFDDYIEIIRDKGKEKVFINVSLPEDRINYKMSELNNLIEYSDFLSQLKDEEPFNISIVDNKEVEHTLVQQISISPLNDRVKSVYKTMKDLKDIFEKFDIDINKEIDISKVDDNMKMINLIAGIIDRGNKLTYTYQLEEGQKKVNVNEDVIALLPVSINLGKIFIWAIYSVKGKAKVVNEPEYEHLNIEGQKVFLEYSGHFVGEDINEENIETINEKYEELSDKYDEPFTVLTSNSTVN